jgi:uncharacterized protein (TIGR04255 family)
MLNTSPSHGSVEGKGAIAEAKPSSRGESSPDLPEYANPPVVEVAISVQFDELVAFKPVHFGLLWERIRSRYSGTEHHPPLPSVMELFGAQGPRRASLTVESTFPIGRCWYLSEDRHQLIQLQPDRLILNWRKLDTDTEYPRYDTLRGRFERELSVFASFISDQKLGELDPTQCELTYVNHMPAGIGWDVRNDLPNLLTPWSGETTQKYLPPIEDARLSWQYLLEDRGAALGRLYVNLQSATSDDVPVFVLQLTGRGAPIGPGVDGVLAFTDRAHEWIVNGFTAITTQHMHKLWKRDR